MTSPENTVDPVPGLRGLEHAGLTVPDMDMALAFFTEVLGAKRLYETGPFKAVDNWMAVNLGVPQDAVIKRLVMIRVAGGPAIELLEFAHAPGDRHPTDQSVAGASHLAFYVDDIDAGVDALRAHALIVLGEVKRVVEGPSAGLAWVHFMAPWGQQFELVSYPSGVTAYAEHSPYAGEPGRENDEPDAPSRDALDGVGDTELA